MAGAKQKILVQAASLQKPMMNNKNPQNYFLAELGMSYFMYGCPLDMILQLTPIVLDNDEGPGSRSHSRSNYKDGRRHGEGGRERTMSLRCTELPVWGLSGEQSEISLLPPSFLAQVRRLFIQERRC